jgi:ribosomal protein S18 acetylase RimI-like enzyme
VDVTIRPRRPADLPALVAALGDTHRTSAYPVTWPKDPAAWLTPNGMLGAWVAEVDGVVVGHVALGEAKERTVGTWAATTSRPLATAAEVTRLFVTRAARGRSLGRRLLATAGTHARASGRALVLGVLRESRAAIAMYERLGWLRLSAVDFTLSDGTVTTMYTYVPPRSTGGGHDPAG